MHDQKYYMYSNYYLPQKFRLDMPICRDNIIILFDGDSAGLRATIRGIDLILEQGMNVRVCSFPEGEDPDSFAKSHTKEEIIKYLKESAKDFIQFKR